MNIFLLLDFTWKFLFFSTILSSFYFIIILISSHLFKLYSASKKVIALKAAALMVILSFILVTVYLLVSDRDLVADCFGQFALKEGVFGVTRVLGLTWLTGVVCFLFKDLLGYKKAIYHLRSSILDRKILKINGECIEYFQVSDQFEPVVAGLVKPQIFIPQYIDKNESALRQILCHELVHLQNKDGLWSFLNVLVHRLNWHNPIAFFSLDKIKIHIEMATDELAVRKFGLKIIDYAEQLVGLTARRNSDSLFVMNIGGDFLQIQSRLLNLKNIQNGKIQNRSFFAGSIFLIFIFGLSQAYASIAQKNKAAYQAQMCFQVNHELIIESWIMEKNKSEINKCE